MLNYLIKIQKHVNLLFSYTPSPHFMWKMDEKNESENHVAKIKERRFFSPIFLEKEPFNIRTHDATLTIKVIRKEKK